MMETNIKKLSAGAKYKVEVTVVSLGPGMGVNMVTFESILLSISDNTETITLRFMNGVTVEAVTESGLTFYRLLN